MEHAAGLWVDESEGENNVFNIPTIGEWENKDHFNGQRMSSHSLQIHAVDFSTTWKNRKKKTIVFIESYTDFLIT